MKTKTAFFFFFGLGTEDVNEGTTRWDWIGSSTVINLISILTIQSNGVGSTLLEFSPINEFLNFCSDGWVCLNIILNRSDIHYWNESIKWYNYHWSTSLSCFNPMVKITLIRIKFKLLERTLSNLMDWFFFFFKKNCWT